MSSLASAARTRLPRLADASARARLVLVPARATGARRTPFVALVLVVLAVGMVGLLLFNTQMQQVSFRITGLQQRADALQARQQSLAMGVSHLRDPQRVAEKARALGMVQPADPAFVQVPDGTVLGKPVVATPAQGVHVRPFKAARPHRLARPPRIVRVAPTPRTDKANSGRASTNVTARRGRNAQEGTQRGARHHDRTAATNGHHARHHGATH
ncbi:MAG: septum formation initiator family protein [Marmoricola sp.]